MPTTSSSRPANRTSGRSAAARTEADAKGAGRQSSKAATSKAATSKASSKAATTKPAIAKPATRRRGRKRTARWDGLDVARGLTVLLAVVCGAGAVLAPSALGPTAWLGLGVADLVPGLFLVVAGAGIGWRVDTGATWAPPRRRRRVVLLVALGLLVALTRAGGSPTGLAPDELLRLAAASGLAVLALRLPRPAVVALTGLLLCVPAAAVAIDPLGRGLRGVDPASAWALESAVGLPTGGVPLVSLPAAVALVLIGVAFGTWAHRRPPGPATAAAMGTVGVWCLIGTVVVGQLVAPVPVLLDLPVALAAVGLAGLVLGAGHLLAVTAVAPGVGAVGRTALPVVVAGTVLVAVLPTSVLPELPTLAALTAGGVAAYGAVVGARRLDATRWTFRA